MRNFRGHFSALALSITLALFLAGCGDDGASSGDSTKKTTDAPTAVSLKLGDKYGVFGLDGSLIVAPRFDYVSDFVNGLAAVKDGGKYGFIDAAGNMVVQPVFENIYGDHFESGLIPAKAGEKWGYIDQAGRWAIPPVYSEARGFYSSSGTAWVRKYDTREWIYIDKEGNEVPSNAGYSNGIAEAEQGGKCGFKDNQGNWVIDPVYDSCCHGPEMKVITAKRNGKYGILDERGKWIVEPAFEQLRCPSSYAIAAKQNGKWGFVDSKGKWLAAPQFDDTSYMYKDSPAFVKVNGQWGYADSSGKLIIEPQFDRANYFYSGRAAVEKNGKTGFINKQGKLVIDYLFESVESGAFKKNPVAVVKYEGKYGIVDKNGVWVLAPKYNYINYYYDARYRSTKALDSSGQYLPVNDKGELILTVDKICGLEIARRPNGGEIVWPQKSEKQICEEQAAREQYEQARRLNEEKEQRQRNIASCSHVYEGMEFSPRWGVNWRVMRVSPEQGEAVLKDTFTNSSATWSCGSVPYK